MNSNIQLSWYSTMQLLCLLAQTFQNRLLGANPLIQIVPFTLQSPHCLLTVAKHDEPFTPMGISPPSLLASATSVSVSLSSSSSIVAAAVTWLRHQAASLCYSASTCLRVSTVHLALPGRQEKVQLCHFFGLRADESPVLDREDNVALL